MIGCFHFFVAAAACVVWALVGPTGALTFTLILLVLAAMLDWAS
jgi:hypothetical protein